MMYLDSFFLAQFSRFIPFKSLGFYFPYFTMLADVHNPSIIAKKRFDMFSFWDILDIFSKYIVLDKWLSIWFPRLVLQLEEEC